MIELLAPSGNFSKLKTAVHFGADAVYCAGKQFGLRAYADNFDDAELAQAVAYAKQNRVKLYVTVNIFPYNADFGAIRDHLSYLKQIGADGVIISDLGVIHAAQTVACGLPVHISTQANITNRYTAEVYADMGAERVVLARETSLQDIKETTEALRGKAETEVFVHGAMCMAYSGRCMMSTYLSGRDSNRGACVQACRWEYEINEVSRPGHSLGVTEDGRGTYIFNSKDLCTLPILSQIAATSVSSMKIEGRMKSEYYVATVTNAYRKALDAIGRGETIPFELSTELEKVNHREYTTGFYLGVAENCPETSKPYNPYDFAATVLEYDQTSGLLKLEQRNRFQAGDKLEIVSPKASGEILVKNLYDADGNRVTDAKLVQQTLYLETDIKLSEMDILRIKRG